MLMKEELAQSIIDGTKRQTRRPIKTGEKLITMDGVKTVMSADSKRIKYQVGREYSIQYGRGLPTRWFRDNDAHLLPLEMFKEWHGIQGDYGEFRADVLRANDYIPLKIKLLDIWAEDVRTINLGASLAEGFSGADEFLCTWAEFYDKKILAGWFDEQKIATWVPDGTPYAGDVVPFAQWLIDNRPAELYQAWTLKFEVVR